ncbi:MAG: hypothetical protein FWG70_07815 [Oscillospiraceae bacterium]|nr:hypothetical protein [Oscillospiraceae bacterium]
MLYSCPVCNADVSGEAIVCIGCGQYLQKPDYSAVFKMPQTSGTGKKLKIELTDANTGEILATTALNEEVKIEISKPTTLRFRMKGGWDSTFRIKPQNSAVYSLSLRKAVLGGGDLVLQQINPVSDKQQDAPS